MSNQPPSSARRPQLALATYANSPSTMQLLRLPLWHPSLYPPPARKRRMPQVVLLSGTFCDDTQPS